MTVQEKSITAGISRRRVKKEIERFSISRIGLDGSQVVSVMAASRLRMGQDRGLHAPGPPWDI